MPDTIEDARKLIESRLAEIRDETGQLERAVAGLTEGGRPRRRRQDPSPRPAAPRTPKRRARRSAGPTVKSPARAPRGRRRTELLAAIEAAPGARPSELAATIGIRPTQVSVLLAKARAEKLIVKSGAGYALQS